MPGTGYGGAINIGSTPTVIMNSGTMNGNQALLGGAVNVSGGSTFTFNGGVIRDNTADTLGTQIRFGSNTSALIMGKDAVISVSDPGSDAYTKGMLGFAANGAKITLNAALHTDNTLITIQSDAATLGTEVLSGSVEALAASHGRFVMVGTAEIYEIDADGRLVDKTGGRSAGEPVPAVPEIAARPEDIGLGESQTSEPGEDEVTQPPDGQETGTPGEEAGKSDDTEQGGTTGEPDAGTGQGVKDEAGAAPPAEEAPS